MLDFLPTGTKSFDYFPNLSVFPDFLTLEKQVNEFWKKLEVPKKYLNKSSTKKRFSFFDGPITANNPMGVHHAWGRTLKDVYLRYNNSLGKKIRYQNGFDCQGLWVEVEVEKQLKLNSKREIFDFGLDRFTNACRARVEKFGDVITEQSQQLGQWMDWDNSYWTHTDTNIEYIWYFLKICNENGWLYKGNRVMPWCPRCGTSLSQHEQMDSYKDITHPSVFVQFAHKHYTGHFTEFEAFLLQKFPQKMPDVALLVWTTTPWTLPANVAVAVHPELDYILVKPQKKKLKNSMWLVLGKNAFEGLSWLQETYVEVFTFKGDLLVGIDLEGPCQSFVPEQNNVDVTVVSWDEVSETDGTGLVHVAPGCGAEDNELGKKLGLPVLAPLTENGHYLPKFGFDGKFFSDVSESVTEKLQFLGKLQYETTLVHRYPSCWRCNEELVYRLVDEWFLSSKEIRPLLLIAIEEVTWDPPSLKARMKDWLNNMADWCISRKRFWGLPLPFYECSDCGELQVMGRVDELWRAAGMKSKYEFDKLVPDLHRPHVDKVMVKCTKCGHSVPRVTEVGDCWLDAGIVPFSTLEFLDDNSSDSYWAKWFPADLVLEMHEQIRLWFYSMLFMSVTLVGKPPYKHVVAYEKVLDAKGEAMHRSKGNALWFYEAADELGADPNRWFYAGWDISKPLLYGFENVKNSTKPLLTLWSCARFLQQNLLLTPSVWPKLNSGLPKVMNLTDVWLVNELKSLEKEVTNLYKSYKLSKLLQTLSRFWDKLSTFWLRNNRQRFWVAEESEKNVLSADVQLAYQLLWKAVYLSVKLFAPVVPHLAEYFYQVLIKPASSTLPESIHLLTKKAEILPNLTKKQRETLEVSELVWDLLETGRKLRQDNRIKNRYRLPELYLTKLDNHDELNLVKSWKNVFEIELNFQNVYFQRPKNDSGFNTNTTQDWTLYLDPKVPEEWKIEWKRSDILRTIQFLRKKASLPLTQKSLVGFRTSNKKELEKLLSKEFKEKLVSDAFVEVVPDAPTSWIRKKVKGLELEVLLKN
ncbi:MAG: Isoleucine--tRNA ligase [Candidatus Heimdallarchaeota archaeon LC_3]|nr:MAG: Isoleucine--tRNA ligase [Candidatus Heimdallarchaeota archaeon LC_3]OLS26533.1 MAG: Isoleucine--tRNA ligase [Candidatus Heimdallarchaeota archaeon LC_3]